MSVHTVFFRVLLYILNFFFSFGFRFGIERAQIAQNIHKKRSTQYATTRVHIQNRQSMFEIFTKNLGSPHTNAKQQKCCKVNRNIFKEPKKMLLNPNRLRKIHVCHHERQNSSEKADENLTKKTSQCAQKPE